MPQAVVGLVIRSCECINTVYSNIVLESPFGAVLPMPGAISKSPGPEQAARGLGAVAI